MRKYIKYLFNKALKERKEYSLHNIPIYILNPLPKHINILYVIEKIKNNIQRSFLSNIDGIYVGEFPEFEERNIEAIFKDGAIYLSSFQDNANQVSEELIIKNIVHEIAHAIEETHGHILYSDSLLENEYNGKKQRLVSLLKQEEYRFPEKLFFSEKFVDELDYYLYKKIGYDKLSILGVGLFLSPYSITSIREYFANGFEEYFMGDSKYLKTISPVLFNKIEKLEED